ncbi:MAG: hypothetical protein M3433_06320 [Actinomycetota bacterium]|nr:hypothetical protein [Actinomycetota bacterium]
MLKRADADHAQRWLFPGLKAGEPTHPAHLAARLRQLGIPIRAGRRSALAALACRIPAPVLADLLGLSAKTTAKASAELKVDYAAYIARRTAPSAFASLEEQPPGKAPKTASPGRGVRADGER